MFGANSILDMGRWALFASQTQLRVTGENIANVNTEGYSRRSVRLEEGISIDYRPGQMGTGVRAAEVYRNFDKFVEGAYLDQSTMESRYEALYSQLSTVEAIFNESSGIGISDNLSAFFSAWNDLSQRADDYGSRSALVAATQNLVSTLNSADDDLALMQNQVELFMEDAVAEANTLIKQIAELNKQINIHTNVGINNPNSLLDERNQLTRQLAEIVDVNVIDNGGDNYTILLKSGQTLVDRESYFQLDMRGEDIQDHLTLDSEFDGSIYFSGTDNYEYTVEITRGGVVSNASGPGVAMYKVSLDGGKTWIKDEDGSVKQFYARPYDTRVDAGDLQIYFGQQDDSTSAPATELSVGDEFRIQPQSGLYWVQNTSHAELVSSQIAFNGQDNTDRLTGGQLAAYFNFRDSYVGKYRDKLEALTESLIWEVNRRHSQGMGLQNFESITGVYSVDDPTRALGSDTSGLTFGSRLQSGSATLHVFNSATGLEASAAALDFSDDPGIQNFDPSIHTLEDVAAAINRSHPDHLNASIVNNALHIEAEEGYEFAFGTDTAGLNAALGLNTFFQGDSTQTIAVNTQISQELNYLATGHVNGTDEVNSGDNTIALAIAELQELEVSVTTVQEGTTQQTLLEYYNGIVGTIGSDVNSVKYNYEYTQTLASDLNEKQQEIAGVNLDEEMSNLIRYQHSYTAAAKLITTADQMLQTILAMKS
ncbi:MAG: flagellar hook-associated protein FlgK [Desulfovibrionaceae bacterium]